MTEFRTVGISHPRLDALGKALGTAQYTDDLTLPGMVYGMVLRSPYSHAKVKRIDASKVERMPGVLAVLTPQDVPQRLYNCSGNPPSALIIPDERVLTDHPLCVGDRILAVAAETMDICERAIRAINIEYEVLPAMLSIDEALKENAPILQPGINPKENIMGRVNFAQGDVSRGFAEADFVFEETFAAQPIQHVAMEPTGCLCWWEHDETITVFSPSQTLFQERRILADLLDRNESDIRIVKPAMGGGFGARQQLHSQHVGILLSRRCGRPVKLMNTREEEMYASVTRHETKYTIKLGVMRDGTITTAHIRNYLNGGPYITHTLLVCTAAGRKFQYRAKHYRYEGFGVYTNAPTAGAMRGYGNIQLVHGRELLISRIARKLNIDPVKLRMQNHVEVGDQFPAAGYDITSCAIPECVEKAEALRREIDDREPLRDDDEIKEAWGVSFCCHSSGPSNKDGMSSAVVMANDDGSVTLSIGSADIGQGSETVMGQIAAECLGLHVKEVSVKAADTASTPYDTGTFASGQTFVCGNAVTTACGDLVEKVCAALAKFHEVEPEAVVYTERGIYTVKTAEGPQTYAFREAVRAVAFGMKGTVLIGSGSYKAKASPPPFAVCYAKAAYRKRHRSIQIKDIIEIVDVGTPINPLSVIGQVEGGVSMGVGYALTEDIETNKRAGKTPTAGLLDYKPPLTVDMPRVHAGIAEASYEPTGPLGAKSVGELASVPVAPAIVDAVCQAADREINDMPLCRYFIHEGGASL